MVVWSFVFPVPLPTSNKYPVITDATPTPILTDAITAVVVIPPVAFIADVCIPPDDVKNAVVVFPVPVVIFPFVVDNAPLIVKTLFVCIKGVVIPNGNDTIPPTSATDKTSSSKLFTANLTSVLKSPSGS